MAINEDVYGGPVLVMAGVSLLLFLAGGILLGPAARRADMLPSRAGVACAASLVAFVLAMC